MILKTIHYTQILFVFGLMLVIAAVSAEAYDQTDRFQLLEDKNIIQNKITDRNSKDGFLFNFSTHLNTVSFVQDFNSIGDSGIVGYENLLSEHSDQELVTFFNLEFIYPLRRIELTEFELTPKVYARLDMGTISNIQRRILTKEEFDAFVLHNYSNESDKKIIREILAFVTSLPESGASVFQHFIDKGGCSSSVLLDFCNEKNAEANALTMPLDSDANVFLYGKTQVKLGMLMNFQIVDDWKGYINVYGLQRGDHMIVADKNTADNENAQILENYVNPDNYQQFIMVDAKFQLKLRPFTIHFLMEELKITRWSDNIDEYGDLYYRNTSLYQLNIIYHYVKDHMLIKPFSGFHKRRGYDIDDGLYLGLDLFNSKTSSNLRMMFDTSHFSITPSVRWGEVDVSYLFQYPYTSNAGNGINTEGIHSLKVFTHF